jgi:hypothetical protein
MPSSVKWIRPSGNVKECRAALDYVSEEPHIGSASLHRSEDEYTLKKASDGGKPSDAVPRIKREMTIDR